MRGKPINWVVHVKAMEKLCHEKLSIPVCQASFNARVLAANEELNLKLKWGKIYTGNSPSLSLSNYLHYRVPSRFVFYALGEDWGQKVHHRIIPAQLVAPGHVSPVMHDTNWDSKSIPIGVPWIIMIISIHKIRCSARIPHPSNV